MERGDERRIEGWLYLIRSSRLGLHYSRKRYFVLEGNALNCYKNWPAPDGEDPRRKALIDSFTRVTDNGRESIQRNVFYVFTIYNTSKPNDRLKLGARSSEEAAKWIKLVMGITFKEFPNNDNDNANCLKKKLQSIRSIPMNERRRTHSIDWTVFSSMNDDPIASDVMAPSMWTIIGCKNGLRLFKESKDLNFPTTDWDDHPAIMAVGVVDASSEEIFNTVMSLGQSRSEWDFCLLDGEVVEHVDGHTDIIHKKLRGDWLSWGMKRRDLLLRRYWRREDDGAYVVLYHSVVHQRCPPEKGYIRAWLKSGGYEISPVSQGKQSVVKHMLAIDWKFWKSSLFTSSAMGITVKMSGRVAALREFFRAKNGNCALDFSSDYLNGEMVSPQMAKEQIKLEMHPTSENSRIENFAGSTHTHTGSGPGGSLDQMTDAADEFFDVIAESDYNLTEALWPSDEVLQSQLEQDPEVNSLGTAKVFVKKLHDITVEKKDHAQSGEVPARDRKPCSYGDTLTQDTNCSMPCSWAMADPSTFLIRGASYLIDQQKVKASTTLMQMVAADWLKSDKREDDLGGRSGGIVQKYAAQGGSEFFFIVNIQVPGATTYSLGLYYMMDARLESIPVLESFVKGDDAYRNSRFKLIPYISKGSWIVKQSVGKKACLVGQALEINYFRGSNYIELAIDVGSSTVARGVVSLVLGYLNSLVIEMAFLIQGNTQEELPESLLGTCRLNHLDASKATSVNP
ncbi:protein ENHANCED DISEASE RESISTANCE 2-like isoform X1 [Zingiber officinale]|uniref:protein ENHANCED DISEASE RESISTANCE 2-like isoform X1 n=1 Tax=Zingiber officinale TaxID=94328 RepID=UPI001C4BC7DA|nr:protein ENHANCED DISEASE RESISTANCE 2-like isoform X1 [Zingiber officinale]